MPALNTPQFDWCKNKMPHRSQPVPPIYQPEVAADAIYHAAHHYRREWYVGGSTTAAIIGNKLFPGLGDWYLAQQGYDAQQYDGAVSPDRRDNVFHPVDDTRDFGAHGDFDDRATNVSWQLWADQRRDWLMLAGLGAAGLLAAALLSRRGGGSAERPQIERRRGREDDVYYSEQLARSPAQEAL